MVGWLSITWLTLPACVCVCVCVCVCARARVCVCVCVCVCVLGIFKIESPELFAQVGFLPWSSWALSPEQLWLQVWATCAQPVAGLFNEPRYLIDILYQDNISMITMKLCTKCVLYLIVVTPFYYWSETMIKILKGAEVHGWINTMPMQNGNFKHISFRRKGVWVRWGYRATRTLTHYWWESKMKQPLWKSCQLL
jgi:hypothetical protein